MARTISNDEVGAVYATFTAHSNLTADDVGKAVAMASNSTVNTKTSEDCVIGKLVALDTENDIATVQVAGFMEFEYTGSPAVSCAVVTSTTAGKVTTPDETPGSGVVVSVDATTTTLVLLLR